MIADIISLLLGQGDQNIRSTVEVFRENAESSAQREHDGYRAALEQFENEGRVSRGVFNSFVDGLNRLPRPAMAIGVLALFTSAMTSPDWFGQRMLGLAQVPDPLWWLLGAIVSFYFGARHQFKAQQFQQDIARTASTVEVARAVQMSALARTDIHIDPRDPYANAAIEAWKSAQVEN